MTITKHKNLYKKDSNTNTRIWWMESEDSKYRMHSGVLNGQIVVSEWTICEGKNIGKKNETTPEKQCLLEVEASYKKKLAQGNYKESLDAESLDQDNYIKPLLAKEYGEDYVCTETDYKSNKVYSNPKLDGIRILINSKGMWSRQGKPIISAPHILEDLKDVFEAYPNIVLDGELYTNKLSQDFNKIISLGRQQKPTATDLKESRELLQYWIYDIESMKETKDNYESRSNFIKSLFDSGLIKTKTIVQTPTEIVKNKDHLDELFQNYIVQGYEGQMIRINGKPYENKRSKQLLKRKEFLEEDFKLVDIVEGEGNRSGMAGNVLCVNASGKVFGAGIQGDRDFFKLLLKEKQSYIDTLVSIKFQNLTPDGIPRFPVAVKFWKTTKREL